jgi:SnoaL-like domain
MGSTDQGIEDRDRREIEALLAHYGHVADDPSLEGIRLIFSEDGVFDATDMDAGLYEGASAIAAFFALGKPPHPPSHHTTNVFVWSDDGTVRALSKYLAPDRDSGGIMSGDYRDVLVRTEDGWRIAERIAIARHPQGQSVAAGFPDAAASEGRG